MQQKELEKKPKHINNAVPDEYMALVKIWQSQAKEAVKTDYLQSFQDNSAFLSILNHSPCVTSILDLRSQQFDFFSSNAKAVLGYESSHFTEKGLAFCNEISHPEDLPNTWKLIKSIWNFILNVPPAIQSRFKYHYDYRIIKPGGQEARILAQNAVLHSDSRGNITHVQCVYSDISRWKRSEHQVASVMSTADNICFFFTADDMDTGNQKSVLSKRELEIVKLMAEGYSSKLIADKLFISFHTVNTHRQRIIEKTNSKNTGEVVQFAVSHGLI